jgi:hypothetical protein
VLYVLGNDFVIIALFFLLIQGLSNNTSGPVAGSPPPSSPPIQNSMATSILPSLQCILQQNGLQRVCFCLYFLDLCQMTNQRHKFIFPLGFWQEEIIKLIKYAEQSYGISSCLYVCEFVCLSVYIFVYWTGKCCLHYLNNFTCCR